MDAVRFGRALGFGARQAAKTVVSAAAAARAENPSAQIPAVSPPQTVGPPADTDAVLPSARADASRLPSSRRTAVSVSVPAPGTRTLPRTAPSKVAEHRTDAPRVRGVKEGLSRFRDSTVEPVVRLSGVLWLEVTGVFFGIFALSTAIGVLRLRPDWRAVLVHPTSHGGLFVAVAVFVLFTYFSISSFIRARRRERRRG